MSSKSKNERLAEWRDVIVWSVRDGDNLDDLADGSSRVMDADSKSPLTKAAAYFGLDAAKRAHRDFLLHILADACFRLGGRPSGAREWTPARYVLLGQHWAAVTRDNKLSDAKAAEKIREDFPGDYKSVQVDAIRKLLPKARDWHNRFKAEAAGK